MDLNSHSIGKKYYHWNAQQTYCIFPQYHVLGYINRRWNVLPGASRIPSPARMRGAIWVRVVCQVWYSPSREAGYPGWFIAGTMPYLQDQPQSPRTKDGGRPPHNATDAWADAEEVILPGGDRLACTIRRYAPSSTSAPSLRSIGTASIRSAFRHRPTCTSTSATATSWPTSLTAPYSIELLLSGGGDQLPMYLKTVEGRVSVSTKMWIFSTR